MVPLFFTRLPRIRKEEIIRNGKSGSNHQELRKSGMDEQEGEIGKGGSGKGIRKPGNQDPQEGEIGKKGCRGPAAILKKKR